MPMFDASTTAGEVDVTQNPSLSEDSSGCSQDESGRACGTPPRFQNHPANAGHQGHTQRHSPQNSSYSLFNLTFLLVSGV